MTVVQLHIKRLSLRYREQAPSHIFNCIQAVITR